VLLGNDNLALFVIPAVLQLDAFLRKSGNRYNGSCWGFRKIYSGIKSREKLCKEHSKINFSQKK
tara:strand:- start:519 stop:710 length:192 start_codon:yes stop_codon:yes gene_type:complete